LRDRGSEALLRTGACSSQGHEQLRQISAGRSSGGL
jgi:hypothetical protein